METKHDDGGPAFPQGRIGTSDESMAGSLKGGLSIRDYFAGQAICVTGMDIVSMMRNMPDRNPTRKHPNPDVDGNRMIAAASIARDAYRIADAMLAARKPKP